MRRGLAVIARARRGAEPLHGRLRAAGAAAARRKLRRCDVAALVRRVAGLETRVPVDGAARAPTSTLEADADQLEQLLINLLRNAVDARSRPAAARRGRLGGRPAPHVRDLRSRTKARGCRHRRTCSCRSSPPSRSGSGIGLVLCRQIAEAHGGTLTLENRPEGGCRATLHIEAVRRPS